MRTGTVKWFNNAKGFGFILPDGGGDDIFAHYSSIDMDGYRTLKAGQAVIFEVAKGDKGLHATQIKIDAAGSSNQSTAKSAPANAADGTSSEAVTAAETPATEDAN